MLGVSAVIVAGLLLSVSVGAYSQFLAGNSSEEFKPRCGRGCSTAHVPPAFVVHYPNLLIAGLLSGSFGVALLIIRRQEIEG
ncbi:exported protein of unknown function [Nitrososphaera viennensis EN76]|uniref:Uncharacterized protein n=2 Tax=Nitrososphaera viennensis TaxID=1034015 RepID=A0A060HUI1_9ARCH|nr:exported protein of unknown function [Nitrososphaera viennensis EN76]